MIWEVGVSCSIYHLIDMPFLRICSITVGDSSSNIKFDESFRVTFDINKNLLSTPKFSTVEIYNLTDSTRQQLKELLQRGRPLLTVYAGYKEGDGLELLYKGVIKHVWSRKDPPDVITTISCANEIKPVYAAYSYAGGTPPDTVWNDYVKDLNVGIDSASDTSGGVALAHGHAHMGLVKDAVDKHAQANNSTVTIEDNNLKIIPKGKPSKDAIVDVNIGTGMVSSPEKIEHQDTDADTSTKTIKDGWKIKMLLQPKIRIGGRINISSDTIKGVYIVDSINHIGDTARGDWQTVVETKEQHT